MKTTKLLKTLLIPTLGISTIGMVATVTTSCGSEKKDSIHVTSVSLDETSVSLDAGATKTLTATVSPEDATDKSVTWTSSDTNVATVDSNGKITAVAKGTAIITVKTNDGGKTATCVVNVTNVPSYVGITANEDSTLELININNSPNLQYSIDGASWSTYDTTINIDRDQTLYLKGNNPDGWSHWSTKIHVLLLQAMYILAVMLWVC